MKIKFVYMGFLITWEDGVFTTEDEVLRKMISITLKGEFRASGVGITSAKMAFMAPEATSPQGAMVTVFHALGNRGQLLEAPEELVEWYSENARAEAPALCGTPRVNAELALKEPQGRNLEALREEAPEKLHE